MATPNNTLTAEFVRSILAYEPDTGLLRWKVRMSNKNMIGGVAGSVDTPYPYIRIRIKGRSYKAHRLAWLIMTGEWPQQEVDHKDRDRSNNRWDNLRDATHTQNCQNVPARGQSGRKGVYAWKGKWTAQIQIDGKLKYLGIFPTPEDAQVAYVSATINYRGEFAHYDSDPSIK